MAIEIKIQGIEKFENAAARLRASRKKIMERLVEASNDFGNDAVAIITKDYLSGPRPDKLGVKSNRLRSSIRFKVEQGTKDVKVRIGTDVEYAAIHEFGGKTSATTIYPKQAGGVLSFVIGGRRIFAKHVSHPGSLIRKRPFLRPGVEDALPKFRENLIRMLEEVSEVGIRG